MKRYRATTSAIATFLAASWVGGAGAADAPTDKIWVADYAGKPPFARRAVSAAEFARFEETKAAQVPAVGERLRIVERQGRPPFRRRIVDIDASNAVEFARFEEVKPARDERRRFGPPGKGFGAR